MARSSNPNSASSQFFIVHRDATFGKLIEGEETLGVKKNRPLDSVGK